MAIRAAAAARAPASRAAFTRGFKIYTRTGDAGSSSLFNGERRSKDHEVFEALGDSDELNAAIGLARAHCETQSASGTSLHDIMTQLDTVQSRLLDVGSAVATPRSSSNEKQLARVRFCDDGASVSSLEQWMDTLDQELPPLKNFILPSGGLSASSLHVARAVCRRTERCLTLSKARPRWLASAAQAADWPRLAEAWGSPRHGLALRGACGAPAGGRLSQLVFDVGPSRAWWRQRSARQR